jgi:hypothetical protein
MSGHARPTCPKKIVRAYTCANPPTPSVETNLWALASQITPGTVYKIGGECVVFGTARCCKLPNGHTLLSAGDLTATFANCTICRNTCVSVDCFALPDALTVSGHLAFSSDGGATIAKECDFSVVVVREYTEDTNEPKCFWRWYTGLGATGECPFHVFLRWWLEVDNEDVGSETCYFYVSAYDFFNGLASAGEGYAKKYSTPMGGGWVKANEFEIAGHQAELTNVMVS